MLKASNDAVVSDRTNATAMGTSRRLASVATRHNTVAPHTVVFAPSTVKNGIHHCLSDSWNILQTLPNARNTLSRCSNPSLPVIVSTVYLYQACRPASRSVSGSNDWRLVATHIASLSSAFSAAKYGRTRVVSSKAPIVASLDAAASL